MNDPKSSRKASKTTARVMGDEDDNGEDRDDEDEDGDTSKTNVMVRNIPNNMKRHEAMEWLDKEGFQGRYNFFYLPCDYKKGCGLGYLFANFKTHADAVEARRKLRGFGTWSEVDPRFKSPKCVRVRWGNPDKQGQEKLIASFRNKPVMHPDVEEEWKPLLLEDGEIKPFPKPKRNLTRPSKLPK